MIKPKQTPICIRTDVYKTIQTCAKYFGTTQSEFVLLLMKFSFLMETDDLRESSIKLFKEHLNYFTENKKRRPGLQEMLERNLTEKK